MNRTTRDLLYSVLPHKYLIKKEGGINLIISAPHGGGMKPINFPRRKKGVLIADTYTRRLSKALYDSYQYDKPYLLVSDIHRSRVDFNREFSEATQGNHKAEELWTEWQTTMQVFTHSAIYSHQKVLYIDLHSHNDSDKFELGYNLSASSYRELMKTGYTSAKSSIDGLGNNRYDMMFGERSIKNSLEMFGYRTLVPEAGNVYFNGGRNIEVYNGKDLGAIQIEVPVSIAETEFSKLAYVLKFSIEMFRKSFTQ